MFPVQLLRENKYAFFLMLWMAIMPLLCSALITVAALKYEIYIRQFTHIQWLLFYLGTSISMAFALTPTTFIALLSGYFLDWQSTPYMLSAYLLASAIGYYLTQLADNGKIITTIEEMPKVRQFTKGIHQSQFSFIILCRISPVLPFAIMNVVLSIMRISFFQFLWAGFLGMLPRTLLFIWIGSTASLLKEAIKGGENSLNQIVFIGLLLFSIAGFYLYFKNILTKKS